MILDVQWFPLPLQQIDPAHCPYPDSVSYDFTILTRWYGTKRVVV